MTFLFILFSVYILAVNFCAFCLIKRQYSAWEAGDEKSGIGDGKLMLVALMGGSITLFATMFALRYRLTNVLLMIVLPVLAVLNVYCFFLGFRSIYLFL